MNLVSAQKFYFSGIGGIGMSALAQLLRQEGKVIIGSEITRSALLKKLQKKGIKIARRQDGALLNADVDIAVFSGAIPAHHPERQKAARLNIPSLDYFAAVGAYMKGFQQAIAVSGTHGKTTTTAMIARILVDAGLDPTVIVGSIVPEFHSNARAGSKKLLVVEACEHQAHMLQLHPHIIVLTNIEEDHLDYYRDLEHIVMTFQKYINHLPQNGLLIKNSDDSESQDLGFDGMIKSYGVEAPAHIKASVIQTMYRKQIFTVDNYTYELPVPGKFNIYNALAAITVGLHFGLAPAQINETLKKFHGVWRRFEILGAYRQATVISDYAHHPTAIHSTIAAAREFYPKRRIIVVFQPHQHSRTKKLFDLFVACFREADFVILQEIFDVAGRENPADADISSRDLVNAVEKSGKYALYSPHAKATKKIINEILEKDDVLLIMGAGDIYQLAESLV